MNYILNTYYGNAGAPKMVMNFKKDNSSDIVKSVVYLVVYVLFILVFALPYTFLLAGGGAEENVNLTKFMFYGGIAIASVMVFFGVKIAKAYVTNKKYLKFFDAWVHDPEKSVLAKAKDIHVIKFFHNVNSSIVLSMLFGLILFIPLIFTGSFLQQTAVEGSFLQSVLPQTSFPGAGYFIEQQVTETADVGLSVWPASPAETLLICAIFSIIVLGFGYLAYIKRWIPPEAMGVIKWFVAPVATGGAHLAYHLFRYGGQETSLLGVFIFGLLTAYLYVLFASLVIPLMYHDVHNLIFKMFQEGYLGSDASIGVVVLVEFVLIFILFLSYRSMMSSKQQRAVV